MAADWIKIEHSLPGKPEVMEIARILDIDEMAVVGHLVCFWVWVDQNLSPECPAVKGTKRGLDRVAGRDKFVDALISVGWLSFDGESFTIPNYEHHLSESAKKRAIEARKKQNQRSRPQNCPADKGTKQGTEMGTREEKRREESLKTHLAADADSPPAESNDPDVVVKRGVSPPPYNLIASEFVAAFGGTTHLTDRRRKTIRARWSDEFWRENWREALDRGSGSRFFNGGGAKGWRITFDFFLRPDTVVRIMEGEFDDCSENQGNGQSRGLTAAEQREQLNARSFQWIRDSAAAANAASGAGGGDLSPGASAALLVEKHGSADSSRG